MGKAVRRLCAVGFAMGVAFSATLATGAQRPCGPRADILDWLRRVHREAPIGVGVSSSGYLVEVMSAPGGATWTIIVTSPRGDTCLVAAGKAWRAAPVSPPGPDT